MASSSRLIRSYGNECLKNYHYVRKTLLSSSTINNLLTNNLILKTITTSSIIHNEYETLSSDVLNLPRKPVVCRTKKTKPSTLDVSDKGLFYTIPSVTYNQLFQNGPERRYQEQVKALNEATFMVRQPFLELKDCLAGADYSQPIRRYLLHGKIGAGKTMTLNSLIHYAHTQGKVFLCS
jgi:hypothetical protein